MQFFLHIVIQQYTADKIMAKQTWEGRRLLKGLPCQLTVEHSVSVSVHFMNKFVHPCKNSHKAKTKYNV